MTTTLYMDKETRELYEQAKLTDPSFNLSQFVRKHLGLEVTGSSESEEEYINEKIKEADILILSAQKSQEFWKQKLITYKVEKQRKVEQKIKEREEQKAKEENKEKLKTREKLLTEYFEKHGYGRYLEGIKNKEWLSTPEFYDIVVSKNDKST